MTKVIVFANQKGGVAKTTTAIALAQSFALDGKKVLFFDLDPQENASNTLRLKQDVPNLYDLMTAPDGDTSVFDTCLQSVEGCKNITAIRGNIQLSAADLMFNRQGREFIIKERLEAHKSKFDVVIMDTPPALGVLTVNALTSANTVVVPISPDGYSLQGFYQLNENIRLIKQHKDSKPREHKKNFCTDISQRPEIAALRIEEGHWEGDTVVGKRAGKEAVVLSLLEKKTENYIAIRIPGKDADSVLKAMQSLREEFGDKFSQVFKTITVDNGSEFSAFSQVESWGCAVYFAHPYTSWERPQNERHNGLFRTFVPKGVSIEAFSAEYILAAADELNGRPRKKLGYRTPEELFDEFLDSVYAAEGCGSIAQDGSQQLPS